MSFTSCGEGRCRSFFAGKRPYFTTSQLARCCDKKLPATKYVSMFMCEQNRWISLSIMKLRKFICNLFISKMLLRLEDSMEFRKQNSHRLMPVAVLPWTMPRSLVLQSISPHCFTFLPRKMIHCRGLGYKYGAGI